MKKENLGIVTGVKGEGQGVKNAVLQTHTLPTPTRKQDTSKATVIITTRDAARKGK